MNIWIKQKQGFKSLIFFINRPRIEFLINEIQKNATLSRVRHWGGEHLEKGSRSQRGLARLSQLEEGLASLGHVTKAILLTLKELITWRKKLGDPQN